MRQRGTRGEREGGVQTGKGMGVKGPGEGAGMYRPRRLGLIKVKLGLVVSLQKLQFIETNSHFLVHKHITHASHTHHTHTPTFTRHTHIKHIHLNIQTTHTNLEHPTLLSKTRNNIYFLKNKQYLLINH